MVSSLRVAAECFGCFVGSTLGSFSFDRIGFEMGTMILASGMCGAVLVVVLYIAISRVMVDQEPKHHILREKRQESY